MRTAVAPTAADIASSTHPLCRHQCGRVDRTEFLDGVIQEQRDKCRLRVRRPLGGINRAHERILEKRTVRRAHPLLDKSCDLAIRRPARHHPRGGRQRERSQGCPDKHQENEWKTFRTKRALGSGG